MMGITGSPYNSCQAETWAKCIAMGYRFNSNNPFAQDNVVLNMPGTEEYDFHPAVGVSEKG